VEQVPFEWTEWTTTGEPEKPCEIVFDPLTIEKVIVLMASAIVVVARPAEEVNHERNG
jgi:hypothetical protein